VNTSDPVSHGLVYSGRWPVVESSQLTASAGRRIANFDPPAAVPDPLVNSYSFSIKVHRICKEFGFNNRN